MIPLRRRPVKVCRRHDAVAGVFLVGLMVATKALSQDTEGHKEAM